MPVELLLDRDRDQLLDLVRGVAQRDRLDLDLRRRELGEDVDLGVRDLGDAERPSSPRRRRAPATGTAGSSKRSNALLDTSPLHQWLPAMSSSAP